MALIPLQSPGLAVPLVVLAVLCVAGLLVGATGSAVVRRLSDPVGKYRLLYLGVVGPFALLAYGLLAALDLGLALRTVLLPGVSGLPGAIAADFVTFLAGGVAGLAAYAPTVRGVRAARDIRLSTTTALAGMARYVVAFAAVFALVAAPFRAGIGRFWDGGPLSGVALVAAFVGLGAAILVASPWVVTAMRSTRRPTDAEADRLGALRERAGLSVRDVRVLETDGAETASALVRGAPGSRRLFVSDAFLDAFDDRSAAALLAVQAGRLETHALARRVGTVFATAVPLLFAVTTGPLWPLTGLAAAVLVAGLEAARRAVTAGDDRAAERVGADAVAAAFEQYADFHALEPSRRRLPNPLSATVPLGDRLDRLRGEDAAGATGSTD